MTRQAAERLAKLNLETEGLLVRALRRGEETPARAGLMIRQKLDESLEIFNEILKTLPAEKGLEESAPSPAEAREIEETTGESAACEEEEDPASEEGPATADEAETDEDGQDWATAGAEAEGVKDLRKFFTINDLFRFKRELFSNDTREFTESLDALSKMSAVPQAREYLRNRAGTNMGKDEMKEFIAILRNYFKRKKGG